MHSKAIDRTTTYSRVITFSHNAVVTENILNVILDPGKSSNTWYREKRMLQLSNFRLVIIIYSNLLFMRRKIAIKYDLMRRCRAKEQAPNR